MEQTIAREQKIGVQIAKLRKEQEITQTELAGYLAVSPQAVSRWENGVSVPDISMLPKIAAFFKVTIDELFGVSDYDKILYLVMKYSSDRNDINYREAIRYLEIELKDDDGNLKFQALKLHMLLQRSREYHAKALELCERLIPMAHGEDEELYAAFMMQRLQFLAEERKDEEILDECIKRYTMEKTLLHLRLYFEVLLFTQRYGKIIEFIEKDDFASQLAAREDRKLLRLYKQLYRAYDALGDREGLKKYKTLIERFSKDSSIPQA